MIKYIDNSWSFEGPSMRILTRKEPIIKRASWYASYKSEPGYTYVSALFLGANEFYGPNKNGDGFPEQELVNKHKTFLNGHHFKHHKNDDPKKSYGTVDAVYYNPDMHRVEGIIKIDNDKSPDMISKIERGEHVPLSMACKVQYDVCSICGKKSTTVKDYCDHLKNHMCEILDDGRQVYAINPNPDFFDISEVIRGADPTACVFRKVASVPLQQKSIPPAKEVSKQVDKVVKSRIPNFLLPGQTRPPEVAKSGSDKMSILLNLAAIEKELPMSLVPYLKNGIGKTPIDKSKLKEHVKNCSLLRPLDFGISGKCAMYTQLLSSPERDAILEAVYIEPSHGYTQTSDRSMLKEAVYHRLTMENKKEIKISGKETYNDMLLKIASINVEILTHHPSIDQLSLQVSVLQNMLDE